jgi:NAD(P)-dependent dehydrogenase (short-subunit alcohol dehydrogenase family)
VTARAVPETADGTGLNGKVCLVTGAGRGLGQAICRLLAGEGAVIVAADIRDDWARAVAAAIRDEGGTATGIRLDVCDDVQAGDAIAHALAEYGRLDILVNNAGIDVTCPFDRLPVEAWDRVLGTNLRGPFLMARAAFPAMKAQRSGHIVNVVSTAAKRAWAEAAAYHASKWGLLGFSHALHVEGRPWNVKVTAVISGGMRTPFLLERFPDIDVARLQDPANVARTVRFVLTQPAETVIPEVMVLPLHETSWP